ncbi:MAG: hypothetical protein JOY78_07175, partial [Pseudonocardia sp.]|nr:hypothetical protein [Pseudonocardia sp.]
MKTIFPVVRPSKHGSKALTGLGERELKADLQGETGAVESEHVDERG